MSHCFNYGSEDKMRESSEAAPPLSPPSVTEESPTGLHSYTKTWNLKD